MFGGGWIGYVYVFAGCGLVLLVLALSTASLYAVARVRRGSRPRSSVKVAAVPVAGDDGTDAA